MRSTSLSSPEERLTISSVPWSEESSVWRPLTDRLKKKLGEGFPVFLTHLADERLSNPQIARIWKMQAYEVSLWRRVLLCRLALPRELERIAVPSPVQLVYIRDQIRDEAA